MTTKRIGHYGYRSLVCTRACCSLLVLSVGAGFDSDLRAQTKSTLDLSIVDPRPVSKAIEVLESEYNMPISYEDPQYPFEGDTVGLPGSNPAKPVRIPRGNRLTLTVSTPPGDPTIAIRQLIEEHVAGGGAGIFDLVKVGRMLAVVPTRTRDRQGDWIGNASVLDSALTIPPQTVRGLKALQIICAMLSAETGHHVAVGTIPLNTFTRQIQLQANNVTAREVLADVLQQFQSPLSWQLFIDPGLDWHVLNIHVVRK